MRDRFLPKVREMDNQTMKVLLKDAQTGEAAACQQLFEGFLPLLRKAAGQSHIRPLGDDAFATASLSFLEAVRCYREEKGVPFPGYLKAKIYGDLRTLFKKERHHWQHEIIASDAEENETNFFERMALSGFEHQTSEKLLLKSLLAALPTSDQQVLCCLFYLDQTQQQTAKTLGITQQAVAFRQKKALQHLTILFKAADAPDLPAPSAAKIHHPKTAAARTAAKKHSVNAAPLFSTTTKPAVSADSASEGGKMPPPVPPLQSRKN